MERRRARRFPLAGEARLQFDHQVLRMAVQDISITGVAFHLEANMGFEQVHGQVGMCRIEAHDLAHPIDAFVSVMRLRPKQDISLLGCRFESISDENLRIIQAFISLSQARHARQQRHAAAVAL